MEEDLVCETCDDGGGVNLAMMPRDIGLSLMWPFAVDTRQPATSLFPARPFSTTTIQKGPMRED
jgi:hypothetical protein